MKACSGQGVARCDEPHPADAVARGMRSASASVKLILAWMHVLKSLPPADKRTA